MDEQTDRVQQANNPLHGIKLKDILEELIDELGWEEMANNIDIGCFSNNPSLNSSLKFLRRTQWARDKVEQLYLDTFHEIKEKPGSFRSRISIAQEVSTEKNTLDIKEDRFTPFDRSFTQEELPKEFIRSSENVPHPVCLKAVKDLQHYLVEQNEIDHNFGLDDTKEGTIIGKMFGVLVVRTQNKEVGYLSAFSGKLAGGNHHSKFVPPVYDMLEEGSFLNEGMKELEIYNSEIKELLEKNDPRDEERIEELRRDRKNKSNALQDQLFDKYHFLNSKGVVKSLKTIFENANKGYPPSAAGECAAPKLLQYAFQHNMEPLAIAEFWWGLSTRSEAFVHKRFYPSCSDKCQVILGHMLPGTTMTDEAIA